MSTDIFDAAVGYAISKHGVDLDTAEAIAKQHLDGDEQPPADATERVLLRKIRIAMQEFRKQKGRDPERLQVIGKADTGVERDWELEKDYQSAIAGLERQSWNEGAAILDQGSVSIWLAAAPGCPRTPSHVVWRTASHVGRCRASCLVRLS
jgi:hypothetical protein